MEKVVKLTEPTQKAIFKNKYAYDDKTRLYRSVVYSKNDRKYIEIEKSIRLKLLNDSIQIHKGPRFNEFDMAVHNAVCSFVEAGASTFSIEQLYRVMAGNQKKQLKANTNISKEIEHSLEKMMCTIVGIAFPDECKKFGLDLRDENGNSVVKVKSNMLNLKMVTVKMANGKQVEGWKILMEPPLYTYAKLKSQIETLNLSHLNVPLNINGDNIRLREYLLGRVLMIKGNTTKSGNIRKRYENCETISFDSLFEIFDIPKESPKSEDIHKRERLLEKCEKVFSYWKEDTGLLKDWGITMTDGTEDGFKLKIDIDMLGSIHDEIWDSEMEAGEPEDSNEDIE